jgi:Ca-activated chloride channel homolog
MTDQKVKLHLSASQNYLLAHTNATVYLMLKIEQPKIAIDSKRLPLNISFVLDRSGSMFGPKMDFTKKAVQFALKNLENSDRVSLVTFDDQVQLPIASTTAENKDQLIQLVEQIDSRGTTNLSGGLLAGTNQVKSAYNKELVNRVILLTDGQANEGITEPARLITLAREISSSGIGISTMGVGDDFNEDLLVAMAEAGNGNFYYIESPDAIPNIFSEELTGLLSVTGQNPTLQVHPAPGTHLSAVFGYEPVFNGGALVNLPDIYSGDSKTILLELKVEPGAPGMLPLAALNFSYYDVTAELARVSYDLQFSLAVTADSTEVEKSFDLTVRKEVELFKAAQAREEAMRRADKGDFDGARGILNSQKQHMADLFGEVEDTELNENQIRLDEEIASLNEAAYSPNMRKNMKNVSYQARKKR